MLRVRCRQWTPPSRDWRKLHECNARNSGALKVVTELMIARSAEGKMRQLLQQRQKRLPSLIGLAVTLCVAYPQASFANPEMKSIIEFLEVENRNSTGGENPAHLQFVGLRCTALFSILTRYLYDNNLSDMAKKFEGAQQTALAAVLEDNSPPSQNFIESQLRIMISAYVDRWQKAKALTGSWSADPIISSDLTTCTKPLGKSR